MALRPGDTLSSGHYRIIRPLGRGGFGFVYLAQDTLLGEEVAIKELIPALVGDESTLKRLLAATGVASVFAGRLVVAVVERTLFRPSRLRYFSPEMDLMTWMRERLRSRPPGARKAKPCGCTMLLSEPPLSLVASAVGIRLRPSDIRCPSTLPRG